MAWSHAVGPDGHVTTLEFEPEYAKIAEDSLRKNGIKNVEVIVGDARETYVDRFSFSFRHIFVHQLINLIIFFSFGVLSLTEVL